MSPETIMNHSNWLSGPFFRESRILERIAWIILIVSIGIMLGIVCKYQFSDPVYTEEGILSRM